MYPKKLTTNQKKKENKILKAYQMKLIDEKEKFGCYEMLEGESILLMLKWFGEAELK